MLFTKSEQKPGWFCWLRCGTLIIIATFAKTNVLSWSVLFQVTKVSFVNIWFGLNGDSELRCISRIRNVQFTMPPIFLTICLTTRHRVFQEHWGFTTFWHLWSFFNTHLLFFFFEVWDSKFLFTGFQRDPADLSKGIFSKIFMRSHLSKFSIRLSIRLIKVCVQFHWH